MKKLGNLILASLMAVASFTFAPMKAADLVEENLINKTASDVSIVSYTSECVPFNGMPDDSRASYVLDKNPNTHWHSAWKDENSGASIGSLPQSITFDLKAEYTLSDITFLSRQDRETWSGMNNLQYNGDITKAKVYVGNDVNSLELIGTYEFETTGSGANMMLANRTQYKRIELNATGRYVKFEAINSCADTLEGMNKWASMAEINFYEYVPEVEVLDKTPLEAKIAEATAIELGDYYEPTFVALGNAIDAANDALNTVTTNDEVAVEVAKLQAAIDALILRPARVTGLNAYAVDYKTIQIDWDAVEGAANYQIYRLNTQTNKWIKFKTSETNSFTVNGVKTGVKYSYRVLANKVLEDGTVVAGKSSSTNSATALLQGEPELEIADNGLTKFDLSWTKVDGATRYLIYRKSSTAGWKKVLTLGGDVTTYTTSSLVPDSYSFMVKAARYDSKDRTQTNGSNEVEGISVFSQPSVKVAAASATSAKISWDAVEGCKYYEVYRATSKDGTYTKVRTLENETSYTNKSLKSGKTYYYMVKAYRTYNNAKVYAPDSKVVAYKVK